MEESLKDFEKIVIAKKYIQKLNYRLGQLESENDELKHEISQFKKLSPDEKHEYKRGILYENLRKEIKDLRIILGTYKRDNERLISKLIQLQNHE